MGSTRRRTAKTRIGLLVAGIAPALLAPAFLAPALARDVGPDGPVAAAPVLEVGPNEQAIARRIDLSIGRSLVVDLPRDAKEVFVANPKVANAVVRSTRKLFLIGIENGATSIFVMDARTVARSRRSRSRSAATSTSSARPSGARCRTRFWRSSRPAIRS